MSFNKFLPSQRNNPLQTFQDVPMEEILPSEEKWKPKLEKKKRATELGHLKSSLNQNMSEMILYNAYPPRYEVEIQTGKDVSPDEDHLKRLLRKADLKEVSDWSFNTLVQRFDSKHKTSLIAKSK